MNPVNLCEIEDILRSRGWSRSRLQDFAAYVEVTGTFPTHLRVASYEALRAICDVQPSALAPLSMQVWSVSGPFAEALNLKRHPMVIMSANLKGRGFRVAQQNMRRSFARAKFEREGRIVWLQSDGYVLTRDLNVFKPCGE